MRDQGQQQLLRNQQMGIPGQPGFNAMRRIGNGMTDMQKAAMQRNLYGQSVSCETYQD